MRSTVSGASPSSGCSNSRRWRSARAAGGGRSILRPGGPRQPRRWPATRIRKNHPSFPMRQPELSPFSSRQHSGARSRTVATTALTSRRRPRRHRTGRGCPCRRRPFAQLRRVPLLPPRQVQPVRALGGHRRHERRRGSGIRRGPVANRVVLPDHVSSDDAALIEPLACAVRGTTFCAASRPAMYSSTVRARWPDDAGAGQAHGCSQRRRDRHQLVASGDRTNAGMLQRRVFALTSSTCPVRAERISPELTSSRRTRSRSLRCSKNGRPGPALEATP